MASHYFHCDYYSLTSTGWVSSWHRLAQRGTVTGLEINFSSKATTQPTESTAPGKCWPTRGKIPGTRSRVRGFPSGTAIKNPPANAGDTGSSPGTTTTEPVL